MLDFNAVKSGSKSFADLAAGLTKADLYQLTDEMIDTMQEIVADAVDADVVFVPSDPEAKDTFGKPEEADLSWTLGHVIVHVTASSGRIGGAGAGAGTRTAGRGSLALRGLLGNRDDH